MRRWIALALLLLLAWLVLEPLMLVGIDAVRIDHRWSMAALQAFAREPNEWRAAVDSAWLAVASVIGGCALGVTLALACWWFNFAGRRLVTALLALPAVLPPLVGVVAFLFLYGETGFVARIVMQLTHAEHAPWRFEGAGAVLWIHITTMYVYSYLLVRGSLASFDGSQLEAAVSLGANRARMLRTVILPLLRPAIINGALLTALSSLASFSAPYVFGGGFRVLPTQIVSTRLNGDVAIAMVETLALIGLSLIALGLGARSAGPRLVAVRKGVAPVGAMVGGRRPLAGVIIWCATVWLLLPHLALMAVSLAREGSWNASILPTAWTLANYATLVRDPLSWRPFGTSIWMSLLATAAAAALAIVISVAARDGRRRLSRWLDGAVLLPWVVPGTVYAIALAAMFSVVQPAAGRFVLIGTLWLLPLAYLLRSLPVVGRPMIAAARALDPALDEAAASLGAGRWRSFRTVSLPLLMPVLAGAAALALVTCMGDFMTSVILYTYDTRPVSLEILSSIRQGQLGIAAAYGVVLTVLSTAAFIAAQRSRAAA